MSGGERLQSIYYSLPCFALGVNIFFLRQWFSNLNVCKNYLEGLLKNSFLDSKLDVLIHYMLSGIQEFAFLVISQVMVMLIQKHLFDVPYSTAGL
jgi:hypothetical protein